MNRKKLSNKISAGHSGAPRGISNYNKMDMATFEEHLMEVFANVSADVYEYHQAGKKKLVEQFPSKKIYFAGPWFTDKDKAFYNLVQQIYEFCVGYTEYDAFFPRDQVSVKPLDAFVKNVAKVQECDVVLALIDTKDVGTAWEIGMGYALDKKVILVGLDASSFLSHTNVMLAFTGECMEIKELANFLLGNDYKTISIKNEWEGIE